MTAGFVQNIDPLAFRIGPIGFRYYTLFFLGALILGYLLWRWQSRRGGYSRGDTRWFAFLAIVSMTIGSRLGHCLFYYPAYFLDHPLEILALWSGGLSSHGAAAFLALALFLAARWRKRSPLDVFDRFTFPIAVVAALVRLGNFMNSEVVGRETALSWGVRFQRFDGGMRLRHPSQIYEFGIGLLVLGILIVIDRWEGRERRRPGMLSAVLLCSYFFLRFVVEFFKEFQTLPASSMLTLGHYLSVPPLVVGVVLLLRVLRRKHSQAR